MESVIGILCGWPSHLVVTFSGVSRCRRCGSDVHGHAGTLHTKVQSDFQSYRRRKGTLSPIQQPPPRENEGSCEPIHTSPHTLPVADSVDTSCGFRQSEGGGSALGESVWAVIPQGGTSGLPPLRPSEGYLWAAPTQTLRGVPLGCPHLDPQSHSPPLLAWRTR